MLTDEQLERIAYALAMGQDRTRGTDCHVSSEMRLCLDAVNREVRRRTSGPFTLAEAVENGYIRRPRWAVGDYATETTDEDIGDGTIRLEFTNRLKLFGIERRVCEDDITATDYEAKPLDSSEKP